MYWWKLLTKHWVLVSIIVLGSFLRTWHLDTQGILFSDAGRDLLVAQQAVETGPIPLLGIPSSVPRFHQGPLTIWLHMIIYILAGTSTLAYSLVFAFLSILALIGVYEFAVLYIHPRVAILAPALLAVSPLAVAHARVPYHIGPIPLVLILFLFAHAYLWEKKRFAVFWAVLSWAAVVQFELALFGLFLVTIYVAWRQKYVITKHYLAQAIAAGLVGFAPQLIHDLTNPLSQNQLGTFFAWVGYRVVSLLGVTGEHQFTIHRLQTTLSSFSAYGQRVFSPDWWFMSILAVIAILFSFYSLYKAYRERSLPMGMELVLVTFGVLVVSYFAHGGPSEAYFPPFPVLLSLLVGYGLAQLKLTRLVTIGLVGYCALVSIGIVKSKFFVSTTKTFNYGPSLEEQRAIVSFIATMSEGSFELRSSDEGSIFPTYLDNYRWVAQELGHQEHSRGMVFFINTKNSSLSGYPGINRVEFTTRDVYFY